MVGPLLGPRDLCAMGMTERRKPESGVGELVGERPLIACASPKHSSANTNSDFVTVQDGMCM